MPSSLSFIVLSNNSESIDKLINKLITKLLTQLSQEMLVLLVKHTGHEMHIKIATFIKMTLGLKRN